MEFYKIWRGWGGTIGVHKMSLGDLAMNYVLVVVLYLVLLAVMVAILPTILIGIYLLWLINTDMEGGNDTPNIQQRQVLMLMSIIGVVYFMIDFHFGFIAFKIIGSAMAKETMDGLAVYNLALGIVSTILYFFGHRIYCLSPLRIARIGLILATVWFGYKFSKAISTPIVRSVITQCSDDENVNKSRQRMIETELYNNGEYVP